MKITKHPIGEAIFPYIAYHSDKISSKPALIVQLHGAGERGDGDKELELVLVNGFAKIANDENLKDAILVMPQCGADTYWMMKIESILAFTRQMAEKYHADPDRIYLCGISMGGFATWHSAVACPSLFAAIAPCCGGCLAIHAEDLKQLPIWAFHGLADPVIPTYHTTDMIPALEAVNPNFRCTLYEGVGHNCWDLAFTEELLSWLLEQHK